MTIDLYAHCHRADQCGYKCGSYDHGDDHVCMCVLYSHRDGYSNKTILGVLFS